MTSNANAILRERLVIVGTVGAASFLPWIGRHARKLGLSGRVDERSNARIILDLTGPADLIDAMEMGCSLGPIDVLVDTIERTPLANPQPTGDFVISHQD